MEAFHQLVARVDLNESEDQMVARYISGLTTTIQDALAMQTLWTVSEAYNRALVAKKQEKRKFLRFGQQYQGGSKSGQPFYSYAGVVLPLLFNSCYASLVKKSEDEEVRELIHMTPFVQGKHFIGEMCVRSNGWGTLHEWIEDYKEDVVKTLSFKASESKFEKPRLTEVGRHIIR
ncbi:hypothetical protein RHGRI_029217 [Rhododendron griersonianum]|uniref:Uncharacterized protein n=1 Tax=Rhododendron griersonianum TaxID=479676 RepID=A0AAV6IIW9_9ERIC|nr:hypothetical protein RHGRI_029217 [Rhododendron griersonianum]